MKKYLSIMFLPLLLSTAYANEQNSANAGKCDIPFDIEIHTEIDRSLATDLAEQIKSMRPPRKGFSFFGEKVPSITVTNIQTEAQRRGRRAPYAYEHNTLILVANSVAGKELVLSCSETIMKILDSKVATGAAYPSANDVEVRKVSGFGYDGMYYPTSIRLIVSPFKFLKRSPTVWER